MFTYLHADLPVAVDDGDGHQDTCAAADRTHEIGCDGEETEYCAAQGRRGWDNTLELFVHRAFTVTGHYLYDVSLDVLYMNASQ